MHSSLTVDEIEGFDIDIETLERPCRRPVVSLQIRLG